MIAKLIMRWTRPDGQLSPLRGNVQVLPDSNVFVGWSGEDGYMTEHSPDGEVVMEARFSSNRSSTYRAYKFLDFKATPAQPPSLKAFAYSAAASTAVTVLYVSWNGATTVSRWTFYASSTASSTGFERIGSADKSGFETVFVWPDRLGFVFAEAISADGESLRNSSIVTPELSHSEGIHDHIQYSTSDGSDHFLGYGANSAQNDCISISYPQAGFHRLTEDHGILLLFGLVIFGFSLGQITARTRPFKRNR